MCHFKVADHSQRNYNKCQMAEEKAEEKVVFSWTDKEVELLLNIVSDYNTEKTGEKINWGDI